MSDPLLTYYRRELSYIHKLAAQFAAQHPEEAARLGIGENDVSDPHVERLIQAFAYLTARIQNKLHDNFPEVVESLVSILYPHYLAPIPSMAIASFSLPRDSGAGLVNGQLVPARTRLDTEAPLGGTCHFQTCYPVHAWPIEVVSANLGSLPFSNSALGLGRSGPKPAAALRIGLRTFDPAVTFAMLKFPQRTPEPMAPSTFDLDAPKDWSLRFYLSGEASQQLALYELLFNDVVEATISNGPTDPKPISLGNEAIAPVGFGRDEGLFPYPSRSFLGYRLLTEYFAMPEKFLFFGLRGLTSEHLASIGNKLEIVLYLRRSNSELERTVSGQTFKLGCTPIVNLYSRPANAIRLSHLQSEYRVAPDPHEPAHHEVYSIDHVEATPAGGSQEPIEYHPFFSVSHEDDRHQRQAFWFAERRPAEKTLGAYDRGTDVFITPVDLSFSAASPNNMTLHVQATWLNRDVPESLQFGGGQPVLHLPAGPGVLAQCITKPTPTLRAPVRNDLMWRLVSHLSLNHLSLINGERGPDALQEVLRIYNFAGTDDTLRKINGLVGIESKRVVGRVRGAVAGGFCRGLEVILTLDEQAFSDNGAFLFGSIMDHFMGLYCSINSFSQLTLKTRQRKEPLRKWMPRAGERILL